MSGPDRDPDTVKFQEQAEVIDGKDAVAEKKYTLYGKEGGRGRKLYPDRTDGATVRQWPETIRVKWQGQVRTWRFEPRWQDGQDNAPMYRREYQTPVYR